MIFSSVHQRLPVDFSSQPLSFFLFIYIYILIKKRDTYYCIHFRIPLIRIIARSTMAGTDDDEMYKQLLAKGHTTVYAQAYVAKVHEGELFAHHFAVLRYVNEE